MSERAVENEPVNCELRGGLRFFCSDLIPERRVTRRARGRSLKFAWQPPVTAAQAFFLSNYRDQFLHRHNYSLP